MKNAPEAPDGWTAGRVVDPAPPDARIAKALALEGTYEVPDYLEPWTQGSFTGSRLRRGPDRRPVAMGTVKRPFWLRVPHSALSGPPHGLVMYGHGLLGSGTQVGGGFNGKIANDHKLIFFAADLTGMAEGDVNQVIMILQEMSRFPSMTKVAAGFTRG